MAPSLVMMGVEETTLENIQTLGDRLRVGDFQPGGIGDMQAVLEAVRERRSGKVVRVRLDQFDEFCAVRKHPDGGRLEVKMSNRFLEQFPVKGAFRGLAAEEWIPAERFCFAATKMGFENAPVPALRRSLEQAEAEITGCDEVNFSDGKLNERGKKFLIYALTEYVDIHPEAKDALGALTAIDAAEKDDWLWFFDHIEWIIGLFDDLARRCLETNEDDDCDPSKIGPELIFKAARAAALSDFFWKLGQRTSDGDRGDAEAGE